MKQLILWLLASLALAGQLGFAMQTRSGRNITDGASLANLDSWNVLLPDLEGMESLVDGIQWYAPGLHANWEPYISPSDIPCPVCEKVKYSIERLVDHVNLQHFKGSPAKKWRLLCSQCDRAFGLSKHLAEHQATHNQKPTICQSCGIKIARARDIKRHQGSSACNQQRHNG